MKMDRDVNTDGTGKYALIKLRNMPTGDDVLARQANAEVHAALEVLNGHGMLDWGNVHSESEFFVMRLKDKFSYRGLLGYMKAIELESEPDFEYAKAILEMVGRAGPYSPFCKLPD